MKVKKRPIVILKNCEVIQYMEELQYSTSRLRCIKPINITFKEEQKQKVNIHVAESIVKVKNSD